MDNLREDELVKIALKDKDAFSEIIRLYKDRVYRYCKLFLGHLSREDSELARDLSQEVFIKLWKNLGRYKIGTNFKAFVFSICMSVCTDAKRKKLRIKEIKFEEKNILPKRGDKNLSDYLENLIESLPLRQRTIIFLRYKQKLPYKEIANVLQVPLGTVKTNLHRAINTLRERLKEDGILQKD